MRRRQGAGEGGCWECRSSSVRDNFRVQGPRRAGNCASNSLRFRHPTELKTRPTELKHVPAPVMAIHLACAAIPNRVVTPLLCLCNPGFDYMDLSIARHHRHSNPNRKNLMPRSFNRPNKHSHARGRRGRVLQAPCAASVQHIL